ncbi:hypothetical protein HUS22_14950 [Marinobacter lutaoensis]|nr:hypothetical protein [Marinobacter lutaoensis]
MIRNRLKSTLTSLLFGDRNRSSGGEGLLRQADSEGMVFYTEPAEMQKLRQGQGEPTRLLQTVALQMLQEQGNADVLCVFQTKVATDSRRSLPPIPRESCH